MERLAPIKQRLHLGAREALLEVSWLATAGIRAVRAGVAGHAPAAPDPCRRRCPADVAAVRDLLLGVRHLRGKDRRSAVKKRAEPE